MLISSIQQCVIKFVLLKAVISTISNIEMLIYSIQQCVQLTSQFVVLKAAILTISNIGNTLGADKRRHIQYIGLLEIFNKTLDIFS